MKRLMEEKSCPHYEALIDLTHWSLGSDGSQGYVPLAPHHRPSLAQDGQRQGGPGVGSQSTTESSHCLNKASLGLGLDMATDGGQGGVKVDHSHHWPGSDMARDGSQGGVPVESRCRPPPM